MSISKKTLRKTTALGITRIPETVTILDIAKELSKFSTNIIEIKIITTRSEYRNALIYFDTVEACEKAKEINSIKLGNEEYMFYFAHNNNHHNLNISASENKVYVKYPVEENFDEISKMFSGISIKKPETAKNYFFATCNDMEEQCNIIKQFNNKKVNGGILTVKVALDRVKKRHPIRSLSE